MSPQDTRDSSLFLARPLLLPPKVVIHGPELKQCHTLGLGSFSRGGYKVYLATKTTSRMRSITLLIHHKLLPSGLLLLLLLVSAELLLDEICSQFPLAPPGSTLISSFLRRRRSRVRIGCKREEKKSFTNSVLLLVVRL